MTTATHPRPTLMVWLFNFLMLVSCGDPVGSTFPGLSGKKKSLSQKTTLLETTQTLTGRLIFEETVEGSDPFAQANDFDIGDWDYALQFVSNPVFQGKASARFEIREDQPLVANGKRAEITIVKGAEGDIPKDVCLA